MFKATIIRYIQQFDEFLGRAKAEVKESEGVLDEYATLALSALTSCLSQLKDADKRIKVVSPSNLRWEIHFEDRLLFACTLFKGSEATILKINSKGELRFHAKRYSVTQAHIETIIKNALSREFKDSLNYHLEQKKARL